MKIFFQSLIPALWIMWLAYWVVSALGAKRVERRESVGSRLGHQVPMAAGAFLLGAPHIAGPALEARFHAHTFGWFLVGLAAVALGLGFSVVARHWLGGNWSSDVTVKAEHELIRDCDWKSRQRLVSLRVCTFPSIRQGFNPSAE
jgi:hypothetical protein